jgi:pimeloyl-ACP methyl ester carboxylesterase
MLHYYGAFAPPEAQPQLIVGDSFLTDPHPFFRNYVEQDKPELLARLKQMFQGKKARYPQLSQVASGEDPTEWYERALTLDAHYIFGTRSGQYDAQKIGELAGIPRQLNKRIYAISGCSHFPMLEEPKAFYATLKSCLSKHAL